MLATSALVDADKLEYLNVTISSLSSFYFEVDFMIK